MSSIDSLFAELQRIEARRKEAMQKGIPALLRIYDTAKGDSGQALILRALLIGIFNGDDHPFDLNTLRGLDESLFEDAMEVIRFDRHAEQEVHLYLPAKAQARISQWAFWKRPRG